MQDYQDIHNGMQANHNSSQIRKEIMAILQDPTMVMLQDHINQVIGQLQFHQHMTETATLQTEAQKGSSSRRTEVRLLADHFVKTSE